MKTLDSLNLRLNARWKRVAFLFWLPLAATAIYFSSLALLSGYKEYSERDSNVRWCHVEYARAEFPPEPGELSRKDFKSTAAIITRMANRAAPETVAIENSTSFRRCMLRDHDHLVLDFRRNAIDAIKFLTWTIVAGLIIFTTAWMRPFVAFWRWVTMRQTAPPN